MRRLTPEEVFKAYEETGIAPSFGLWYEEESNCACGIGVILAQEKGKEEAKHTTSGHSLNLIFENIKDSIGLEEKYTSGFIDGFDDERGNTSESEEYVAGYEDGTKVRLAILDRYPDTVVNEEEADQGY